jgi:hypothetical protein
MHPARLLPVVLVLLPLLLAAEAPPRSAALREGLTFYAPFDGSVNAAVALGDPALYSAPSRREAGRATAGPPPGVQLAMGAGRRGDALRVSLGGSPFLFFRGERNMPYRARDWSGTVSIWFSLDPDADLAPGYSDPLIITPRAWNDAAMFVDFTRDDVPRRFRFAAFADRAVWDPAARDWEEVPAAERPMIEIAADAFERGRWTHVAWTFERFNSGGTDGVLTCYIDGERAGALTGRTQTYTWEPRDVLIGLGVQYNGLIDELAIFDRVLTADEIRTLGGL